MDEKKFAGIDLLRFFAAVIVCFYHIAFLSWIKPDSAAAIISGGTYRFVDFSGLFSVGWVGVEIFFVISGFVITFSADGSSWHFLRSRILRLYPAVWFCAPLTLAISLYYSAYPVTEMPTRIVRSLILWPKGNWVDGVYWTLGIEISFYFLVFLLLKFASRNSITSLLLAVGAVSSTYWLSQLSAEYFWNISLVPDYVKQGVPQRFIELSLISHGCLFAIGGLTWNVMCNGHSRWLWLAIGYLTCGALTEIHYTNLSKQAWVGVASGTYTAQIIWMTCMIFLWISVAKRKSFEKYIHVSLTRTLGRMTYPLYLLHTTIGCAILFEFAQLGLNRWIAILVSVLVSLAASWVVAVAIEPTIKHSLANILDARKFTKLAH